MTRRRAPVDARAQAEMKRRIADIGPQAEVESLLGGARGRRRPLYLLVMLVVVGLVFAALQLPGAISHGRFVDHLARAAADATVAPRTFRVADEAPFPWDRVYVFGPRTSVEAMGSAIGVVSRGIREVGLQGRDDIALIVFERGTEAIDYVAVPRDEVDLAALHTLAGDDRKRAVWVFARAPDGRVVATRALSDGDR